MAHEGKDTTDISYHTELLETKLQCKQVKEVELKLIDPKAIPLVRAMSANNEGYTQLKKSIEKDGQKQPIIIRKLTAEERKNLPERVVYGIIDGHHRFAIAQKLKHPKILAAIDTEEASPLRDKILAMRFNVASIKMSSIDKGKVIEEILESIDAQSNEQIISQIGLEIFGLKKAMTYRCLRNYRDSKGKPGISKPHSDAVTMEQSQFISLAQNLPVAENLANIKAEEGLSYLENIRIIEKYLQALKKNIKESPEVAKAIHEQQKQQIKKAREGKNK